MIFLSRLFLSMSAIAFLLIGLNTLYDRWPINKFVA